MKKPRPSSVLLVLGTPSGLVHGLLSASRVFQRYARKSQVRVHYSKEWTVCEFDTGPAAALSCADELATALADRTPGIFIVKLRHSATAKDPPLSELAKLSATTAQRSVLVTDQARQLLRRRFPNHTFKAVLGPADNGVAKIFSVYDRDSTKAVRLIAAAKQRGEHHIASKQEVADRLRSIRRAWFRLPIILLAIYAVDRWFDSSEFSDHLRQIAYARLQSGPGDHDLPVTIIDTSALWHRVAFLDDDAIDNEIVTDRESLREVIEEAAKEQPVGIGVDIDLGRFRNGPVLGDSEFLKSCKALSLNGPKIFLAVRRSLGLYPNNDDLVLDDQDRDAKYGDLLVHGGHALLSPYHVHTAFTDLVLTFPPENLGGQPIKQRIPSLAAKLGSLLRPANQTRPALAEKDKPYRSGKNGLLEAGSFIVNYNILPRLLKGENVIRIKAPSDIQDYDKMIRGHLVIVGDANDRTDVWWPSGQDSPATGLYWQACATYTFAAAPLYAMNPIAELLLNLLAGTSIMASSLLLRRWQITRRHEVSEERLGYVLAMLTVVFFLILGYLFVRVTHVLWLDVFVLALGLGFHRQIETGVHEVLRWLEPTQQRFGRNHAHE